MEQLQNFGDDRQVSFCCHCGGPTETRDHVPSRVLLDEPYPPNLPVVFACNGCNSSFSKDEEYVACLVECARVGSVSAPWIERERIKRILLEKPALAARLAQARRELGTTVVFDVEVERVRSVALKLARGHAVFEMNEPQLEDPSDIRFFPLGVLSPEQRATFEQSPLDAGLLAPPGKCSAFAAEKCSTGCSRAA